MAKEKEYKKYDSTCYVTFHNARLAKDAEVRDGEHGKMVRITTVATSRHDKFSDLWLEVNVGSFNANAAAYLEKGDVLSFTGRLALRRWGDDDEKFSIVVERAELFIPIELLAALKERGFDPSDSGGGDKKGKGKPAGKSNGKKAPAKPDKKPAKGGKKKPEPVEIPDDEDDEFEIDDEDGDDGDDGDEE